MDEYIKRQAAIAAFNDSRVDKYYGDVDPGSVIRVIEQIPAADVRPVVRGKWEVDGHHIRCSICSEYMCIKDREGAEIPREYCPNCGADMREKS